MLDKDVERFDAFLSHSAQIIGIQHGDWTEKPTDSSVLGDMMDIQQKHRQRKHRHENINVLGIEYDTFSFFASRFSSFSRVFPLADLRSRWYFAEAKTDHLGIADGMKVNESHETNVGDGFYHP